MPCRLVCTLPSAATAASRPLSNSQIVSEGAGMEADEVGWVPSPEPLTRRFNV